MNDAVIGLDAVTMVVSGKCPKQIEQRVEKRNKQGQLYLRVDKTKQRDTYNVTIVLPSIISASVQCSRIKARARTSDKGNKNS